MDPRRSTELRALVFLVALAASAGCSAPMLEVDAGEDAGEVPTDGGDADLERCGGLGFFGFTYFEYTLDGVPGNTGCVPARALAITRRTTNRTAPALEIPMGPYDTADTMPSSDPSMRGLPHPVCGASIVFENTSLESGSTGSLVDVTATSGDGRDPRTYVNLAVDATPEDGQCVPEVYHGTLLAGSWRVLTGGGLGDTVDIEARDVTFAPFDGHTFELTRMRFHVPIAGPLEYP